MRKRGRLQISLKHLEEALEFPIETKIIGWDGMFSSFGEPKDIEFMIEGPSLPEVKEGNVVPKVLGICKRVETTFEEIK